MDEYILKKDAINATHVWNGDTGTEAWIRNDIEKIPAADVRPVVRGKWETDTCHVYCSICGEYEDNKSNFCPNCGADMRGE